MGSTVERYCTLSIILTSHPFCTNACASMITPSNATYLMLRVGYPPLSLNDIDGFKKPFHFCEVVKGLVFFEGVCSPSTIVSYNLTSKCQYLVLNITNLQKDFDMQGLFRVF